EDEMIDVAMPEEGTDGHITLLVAERLATGLRSGESAPVPVDDLEDYIESLLPRHRTHWRKNVAEPGAVRLLVAEAITRLERLRLITCHDAAQQVTPRAAIGRFALGELRQAGADSLWEQKI